MTTTPPLRDTSASPAKRRSEKTPIFRFLAAIALPAMAAIAKFDIRGRENVPAVGAFVLAPNHFTNIDPLVVGASLYKVGRMPRYLAKASLFKVPVLGAIMRTSGQIPVERTGHSRASDPLAAAGRIAKHGLGVIIYPEGSLTRDPDLWPMRGKFGAVRTALEQDIPLIPVVHWGDQKILPQYNNKLSVFPRKKVIVQFGPPVDLSQFRGRSLDNATLSQATERLMSELTSMLEDIRQEKAPATRWDPAAHDQSETGRIEPS